LICINYLGIWESSIFHVAHHLPYLIVFLARINALSKLILRKKAEEKKRKLLLIGSLAHILYKDLLPGRYPDRENIYERYQGPANILKHRNTYL
jgi:hypothetical protein